ncbi:MAG: hypothetical protein LBK65_05480 [Tannerellaceae bacterium]|jgi:hypothetical protein|nr:hypothetical protein [Tannerellaceae bacterium]
MVITYCLLIYVVVFGVAGIYSLKKDSADGRLLILKISLQTLVHNPEGIGTGNFSGRYGH